MRTAPGVTVGAGCQPSNLRVRKQCEQQGTVSVSPDGMGSVGSGGFRWRRHIGRAPGHEGGRTVGDIRDASRRSASTGHQSKNAASTRLRGVICVSDWLSHLVLPRTPSLELSVLPNGGGQIPGLAKIGPIVYDIDGAEGDRTPDLCIANAALSQLSYSPALIARQAARTVSAAHPSHRVLKHRSPAEKLAGPQTPLI